MIKYVLVAMLQVYGGNQVTIHEFSTEKACLEAEKMLAEQSANTSDKSVHGYSIKCIEDETTNEIPKSVVEPVVGSKPFKTSDDLPVH